MRSCFPCGCVSAFENKSATRLKGISTQMVNVEGPSRLCIKAIVALTLQATENSSSMNGSTDTPKHCRECPRKPETWMQAIAKTKRAKGEEYTSSSTGKKGTGGGPPARTASASTGASKGFRRMRWLVF